MSKIPPLSEELKQQTLEAYEKANHCKAAAAKLLGWKESTYKSRYRIATKDKSSTHEHLEPLIPDGQNLRGISTMYDADGNVKLQWVKTKEDVDRTLEIIREAAEAMADEIPREKAKEFKGRAKEDLASLYVLTDYHLGMMAKAGEAGEEWNTDKALVFLINWFSQAIKSAPDAEVGILCQLGDFLHYDSLAAVTPTHRHVLDTDTRYGPLVNVAIKALRTIIEMMLKKHKKVHIIMAEGNHDIASSVWLRALFADKYELEPRVTVDNSSNIYYSFHWGKTALFFHHGHQKKMGELSKTFVAIYPKLYGDTIFRYGHLGNFHHEASKEDGLMLVTQHPTMAPKDAYAARGGYMANRGASVIVYSKEHGEVSRITIRPEMVDV